MFARFASGWKSKLSLSQFLQMKWNNPLFRFLPFSLSRCYIEALGRLYYLVNRSEKLLIRETINRSLRGQIASGLLLEKIQETFRGIFAHYHEKLFVGYANFAKVLDFVRNQVRFQGREELPAALAAGRGVILVTGHFGAVELLPGALAVNGFPTSMICRFQTTRLREAQGRRAAWTGLSLIDPDRANGFLAAVKALKEGRILIIECDEFEKWRPDPQRKIQFLQRQLSPDRTLDLLHRRSGAPVITALVHRDGQRRYTCHLTAVGQGPAPVNLPISEQCLAILEAAIQNHPEQWYQWKEFGKMSKTQGEIAHDHQEGGYLAPETAVSFSHQA